MKCVFISLVVSPARTLSRVCYQFISLRPVPWPERASFLSIPFHYPMTDRNGRATSLYTCYRQTRFNPPPPLANNTYVLNITPAELLRPTLYCSRSLVVSYYTRFQPSAMFPSTSFLIYLYCNQHFFFFPPAVVVDYLMHFKN